MPSNSISLYCGSNFTVEQEHEMKERARAVAFSLSHGRAFLGQGSYGNKVGRPAGVSIGHAISFVMKMRPDAIFALFMQEPEKLRECVEFMLQNSPILAAAITAGMAQAQSIDAPAMRQLAGVAATKPIQGYVDPEAITDEMLDDIDKRISATQPLDLPVKP